MCEDIYTKHHFNSGVYSREMHLPEGWAAETHKHKFSHMSILASGKVKVTIDNIVTEYTAPVVVSIEAGKVHGIYAYTDSIWFCIHATEETEVLNLDKILIEEA